MKSTLLINATGDATGALVSAPQRRLLKWSVISGFWIFFGLLNASQLYLGLRMEGFPTPVARMFGAQTLGWSGWALLTPIILWLGRRFPLERSTLARGLLVHIPACLLISAAHLALGVSYHQQHGKRLGHTVACVALVLELEDFRAV